MQSNLILRLEESRSRLIRAGERVRGEAIDRELKLLEGLEALLVQLQKRVRAEKRRLQRFEAVTAPAVPVDAYDTLNAKQVLAELVGLTDPQRAQVLAYERAHKNRKTIVRALAGRVAA